MGRRIIGRLLAPSLIFAILFFVSFAIPEAFPSEGRDATVLYAVQILVWFVGAFLFDRILKFFFWEGIVSRSIEGPPPRLLVDLTTILIYVLGITGIAGIVFKRSLTGFWATSGAVGLVLGFALRNVIMDLFTGVAVNIDRPYRIGDWVHIQGRTIAHDLRGQIAEINWRTTRIETEECTLVVIPNSLLSTMTVTNLWSPDRKPRFETKISLDHSVPVERADRVLTAALKSVVNNPGFLADPKPHVLVDAVSEMGVEYTLRYWVTPWDGTAPAQAKDIVTRAAIAHLSHAGITPAYPKNDLYIGKMPPARHLDSMSLGDRRSLLEKVDLLAPLGIEELEQLAGKMRQVPCIEGADLITAGDPSLSMFILVEGLMEVVSFRTGEPRVVATILPGECIGEMAFFGGMPRTSSVRAATGSVAYEISKDDLNELFDRNPAVLERISSVLAERLEERDRRIALEARAESLEPTETNGRSAAQILTKLRSIFRK